MHWRFRRDGDERCRPPVTGCGIFIGPGNFRNASIIGAGDPAAATAADRPQKTPIDAATDITEADIARPAYDLEDARNLAADIAQ